MGRKLTVFYFIIPCFITPRFITLRFITPRVITPRFITPCFVTPYFITLSPCFTTPLHSIFYHMPRKIPYHILTENSFEFCGSYYLWNRPMEQMAVAFANIVGSK